MKGLELIRAAYTHQTVERPPWVPFAGIHAGFLKGHTATAFLTDEEKLLESLLEVNRLYMPDGQPVAFDLQLEAEILGCDLIWADNNPPSVTTHPYEKTMELPTRLIEKTEGRLPVVLNATRRFKEIVGDSTAVFGLICGPLTLASHLRGTRLYIDMRKKPDHVRAFMEYTTQIALRMIDFYAEAGVDLIAPVDPVVSQIAPASFEEFVAEPYRRIFDRIRELGRLSAFFVCGNAVANLEVMCKTGPDGISIDENIPMPVAKAITDRYNVTIGGNIPLTTTMLYGNQQDNMKYVVDMVDSVSSARNLVVAPGCDMPYNTPVENAIAISEAVHDIPKYREILKNYESADDGVQAELPDYTHLPRPLVEAFTLDSTSCAACQYLWAAVCDAKALFGDQIDTVEYKYTTREGIAQCKAMGVKNLPSIYINGELAYASIIPDGEEFHKKISELLQSR